MTQRVGSTTRSHLLTFITGAATEKAPRILLRRPFIGDGAPPSVADSASPPRGRNPELQFNMWATRSNALHDSSARKVLNKSEQIIIAALINRVHEQKRKQVIRETDLIHGGKQIETKGRRAKVVSPSTFFFSLFICTFKLLQIENTTVSAPSSIRRPRRMLTNA